ncbi:Zinc-finger homeodomain protein [Actinidia chinensis var. chinensis]|uniref:Zinc-finger homeodomain protein n=1 Tax=Actinidia chinensis var. chinensis TaxID=1590841 RepID=A0A2R6R173_ACTCC|nr:Zinc-finger homeodomain protein [Actinidia chinensis var. chinensis]
MELSSQEVGEIPIPINASYGHPMIHHHHIIPTTTAQPCSNGPTSLPTTTTAAQEAQAQIMPYKKRVFYRECLKNHAASMGGNALDGCGEFMPSGEEGTLEALLCSACNCHRNFHRKELEGEQNYNCDQFFHRVGRKVILGHASNILGPKAFQTQQMVLPYSVGPIGSESDELEEGGGGGDGGGPPPQMKKRFRTKFTQEQKEKMLGFAERVGWKMQKQEENVVQQLCQEIGIKRRVLKVWMHNNKHNLAKKNISNISQNPI